MGDRVLCVGGNGQAVGAEHHEVVMPTDERTVKVKPTHTTEKSRRLQGVHRLTGCRGVEVDVVDDGKWMAEL